MDGFNDSVESDVNWSLHQALHSTPRKRKRPADYCKYGSVLNSFEQSASELILLVPTKGNVIQ